MEEINQNNNSDNLRHLETEADRLIRDFYPNQNNFEAPKIVETHPSSLAPSRLQRFAKKNSSSTKFLILLSVVLILVPTLLVGILTVRSMRQDSSKKLTLIPTALPQATPSPMLTSSPKAHVIEVVDEGDDLISPSPKASPLVSPKASASPGAGIDLSVEDLQVEDPQTGTILSSPFYAGQRVTVRAKLRNIGTLDAGTFSSNWNIKGTVLGSNSSGKLKAGATAVYDDVNSITAPIFFLSQESNLITYSVDTTSVLTDINRSNNTKSLTISAGATRSDLEPITISFYDQGTTNVTTPNTVGQKITARVTIRNNGQDKQTNYSLSWLVNDSQVKETQVSSWVNPSNSFEEAAGYDFTLSAGTTNIKAEINTTNSFPETNSANNSKTSTLSL